MILSDQDLCREINAGQLVLDPFDPQAVQPASIDLRLGDQLRVPASTYGDGPVDPRRPQDVQTRHFLLTEDSSFVLHPGQFVLGSTWERVAIPDHLAARLEGKSSLGRLGLLVHSTAGFIDPGFCGEITLELFNAAPCPILLWPQMWIGQLCVMRLTSRALAPYGSDGLGSKYQYQQGPTPARPESTSL